MLSHLHYHLMASNENRNLRRLLIFQFLICFPLPLNTLIRKPTVEGWAFYPPPPSQTVSHFSLYY